MPGNSPETSVFETSTKMGPTSWSILEFARGEDMIQEPQLDNTQTAGDLYHPKCQARYADTSSQE